MRRVLKAQDFPAHSGGRRYICVLPYTEGTAEMERLRWVNEKQTGAAMAATRKAPDAESTLEKKLEDADAALRRAEEETAAAQAVEEQEALRKNIEAAKEIN